METLGERVTRLRKALELTQDELAKKAGVGQSTINGVEKGARQKMPSSLIEIAHALGVDAFWLKTGNGSQGKKTLEIPAPNYVQETNTAHTLFAREKTVRDRRIEAINALLQETDDYGLVAMLEKAKDVCRDYPITKQTQKSSV